MASERIAKIEQLLSDYEALQNDQAQNKLQQCEDLLVQQVNPIKSYDALEKKSLNLQLKVSSTLKALVFDERSSDTDLLAAVNHYHETDGVVG